MKAVVRIERILSTAIFVSGVLLYLAFSIAHPLLHNHQIDGKHHHNCPVCNFLSTASFSTVPEAVIIPIIFQITPQIFFDYQQSYQQVFHRKHSIRAPPIIPA